jgi:hypothetical protein
LSALAAVPGSAPDPYLRFPNRNAQDPGNWVIVTVSPKEASSCGVRIDWHEWDPRDLRDGDTYRVTLTDSLGTEVAALSEPVDYTESYPNGRECDRIPCRQAQIVRE